MIENIRKYTGLIIVVIVVLVLGFIFMDTSGLFSQRAGGGGDHIQIDGRNYSRAEFNKLGKNSMNLAQSIRSFDEKGFQIMQFARTLMSGAQTEETAAQNFFACRMILSEAFDKFGIHPSQEEIEEFIKGLSSFQVRPASGSPPEATTGAFDQVAYNNFIDNFIGRFGLREADLQALVSDVIATSKLRNIIGEGLTVSRDLAEATSIVDSQQIEVSVSPIEIESFRKAIQPTDEELNSFWDEVKDGYMTEKRIKVSYFVAAPEYPEAEDEAPAEDEEQTEEEKKAAADAKAEKEASEIEAKDKIDRALAEEMNILSDALISSEGGNFETLAKDAGLELVSTDWFTIGTLPEGLKLQPRASSAGKNLPKEMFALTMGPDPLSPFTDPIAVGTNQWVMVRLDGVEEPRVKTFEEAKEVITKRYIDEKADEALKEHVDAKVTAIKASMAAGKTFAEAAKEAELSATDLGPFGPSDTLVDGYTAGELFPPASTVNPGEIAKPIYTEERAIILGVKNRQVIKDDNRGQQIDAEMSRLATENATFAFDAWLTQRLSNAEVRDLTK